MAVNKEHHVGKTDAEIVKAELENFLRVTALKSVQFAQHSAHWIESIFWIILLVGGTAFAIRDVRKVCELYTNEETYTNMSVNGLQKLTLDDAIVCVGYDPRALNLSDPRLVRHADELSKVVNLARRANTSAIELLNRLLKLITTISLIELGRTTDYEKKIHELRRGDDLQELQNWLRAEAIDISDLSREVGMWLCNSLRLRIDTIKRGNLNSSVNPCKTTRISWLGVIPLANFASSLTTLCVDVGGKITFESMFDRVVVSFNTDNLFPSLTANGSTYFHLSSYFDFSGDPVSTDMTKDFLMFPTNGCKAFEIGVGATLRLIDRWIARCNTTAKTRFLCYVGCGMLTNTNVKLGSCTLLTWRHLETSNGTLCFDIWSITEHVEKRRLLNTKLIKSCWTSCLFPCEYRQYDVGPAIDECYKDYANATTEGASIELSPKRFSIPVFEERYIVGVSNLFSYIGGTCGIWLGVGLMGICHAFLFPLKLLIKLLSQKRHARQTKTPASVELDEHF